MFFSAAIVAFIFFFQESGSRHNSGAVRLATEAVERAGMAPLITVSCREAAEYRPAAGPDQSFGVKGIPTTGGHLWMTT